MWADALLLCVKLVHLLPNIQPLPTVTPCIHFHHLILLHSNLILDGLHLRHSQVESRTRQEEQGKAGGAGGEEGIGRAVGAVLAR